MTTAKPLARYSAIEGALANGFVTAELHHLMGHDRIRFLVRAPKSQYRQANSTDDGLFLEANALNSLEKEAFQQTEFCLTVFWAANRSISARNGGHLADGHST